MNVLYDKNFIKYVPIDFSCRKLLTSYTVWHYTETTFSELIFHKVIFYTLLCRSKYICQHFASLFRMLMKMLIENIGYTFFSTSCYIFKGHCASFLPHMPCISCRHFTYNLLYICLYTVWENIEKND